MFVNEMAVNQHKIYNIRRLLNLEQVAYWEFLLNLSVLCYTPFYFAALCCVCMLLICV